MRVKLIQADKTDVVALAGFEWDYPGSHLARRPAEDPAVPIPGS
jgi:hypothetical protein